MRIILQFTVVLCLAVAVQAEEPEKQTIISVGRKMTRITQSLDKAGFADYVEAVDRLKSMDVTPQTNHEVVFRNIMGPKAIEFERAKYYRRLGIPVPPAHKQDWFVNYLTFARIQGAKPVL